LHVFSLQSGHNWNLVQEIVLAWILRVVHSPERARILQEIRASANSRGSELAIATSTVLTADAINSLKICVQKILLASPKIEIFFVFRNLIDKR
jgi:hypothetical protein